MPASRARLSAISAWVNSSGTTALSRNRVETPEKAPRSESTSSRSPCTTLTPAGKLRLGGIADERAHIGAALDELFDDLAADCAGCAGNEDGHGGHSGFGETTPAI